jgi:HEAT repeat protein
MGVFPPNPSGRTFEVQVKRPDAPPHYGTLGPGADVALGGPDAAKPTRSPSTNARLRPIAIAGGILLAILVRDLGNPALPHQGNALFSRTGTTSTRISATSDPAQLDRLSPQKQAVSLLELAVHNSDGAVGQIFARVDRWRGRLKWDPQISALSAAALDSQDLRVRQAGIEVELAAYGLAKTPASVEYLIRQTDSSDRAQKIWALWALGAMGSRGVERERAVQVLVGHLKDSDQESRRWSVESLALVGTADTIAPLLQAMHDDPSALVRERAACSLAESGMLSHEQRLTAVPQLVNYTDDPALDAQTHAWAFQALADITRQQLPNDAAAWRNWYANRGN